MIESRIFVDESNDEWTDRKRHKREQKEKPSRLFHASTVKYKVGDVIAPYDGKWVFLSTDAVPHQTIIVEKILPEKAVREAKKEMDDWDHRYDETWYVYEVEPLGDIRYGHEFKEVWARQVKVIKRVGNAKGIGQNEINRKKVRGKGDFAGSLHSRELHVHGAKVKGLNQKHGRVNDYQYHEKEWNRYKSSTVDKIDN